MKNIVAIKGIIMSMLAIVIAIVLVPTIWDAVWVDASATTGTGQAINGTTWTLLRLAPLVFVGVIVFGAVLLTVKGR